MSDWIDAGEAGDSVNPDEKGCMIAAIFFGIIVIAVFVIIPLLF